MRALYSGLAAAALMASAIPAATATETTRTVRTFTCPAANTTLRVIFDSSDDTVIVTRIRQPDIRLDRAEPEGDDAFRYVRSNNRHELSGDFEHVRWRVGRAEWDCRAGG